MGIVHAEIIKSFKDELRFFIILIDRLLNTGDLPKHIYREAVIFIHGSKALHHTQMNVSKTGLLHCALMLELFYLKPLFLLFLFLFLQLLVQFVLPSDNGSHVFKNKIFCIKGIRLIRVRKEFVFRKSCFLDDIPDKAVCIPVNEFVGCFLIDLCLLEDIIKRFVVGPVGL